uniref:Uncharacterized protein n=1 Tax=Tanacetum cinerariifolium TaxID=118510 RepID=A0A6L2LRY7_TANCI|nr:hypothetical protein [Tanacetum cinerariifolium]
MLILKCGDVLMLMIKVQSLGGNWTTKQEIGYSRFLFFRIVKFEHTSDDSLFLIVRSASKSTDFTKSLKKLEMSLGLLTVVVTLRVKTLILAINCRQNNIDTCSLFGT